MAAIHDCVFDFTSVCINMEELDLTFSPHLFIESTANFRAWHERAGVLGPIDTASKPRLGSAYGGKGEQPFCFSAEHVVAHSSHPDSASG